jgi:Phage integrase, N-terminal SAM-like domain
MHDRTLIGPWIRRFLLEHLVSDRNLTRNTQASYRDTLLLLLPFVSQAQKKPTDRLMIDDLSPSRLRSFLTKLRKPSWSRSSRCVLNPATVSPVVVTDVLADFRVFGERPAISRAMTGISAILRCDLIIGLAVG